MSKPCIKCKDECGAGEAIVICEGFCEGINRYHTKCVGLSDEQRDACFHRNIIWMCDDCRDLLQSLQFRATINKVRSAKQPIESEVECLKSEVAKMNETMHKLMDTVMDKCAPAKSALPAVSTQATTNVCSSDSNSSPLLSSTRVNETRSSDHRCGSSIKLFISNISNDVTEAEVLTMISEAIGVDEVRSIKCLAPSWRDISSMDYISFKVEVDEIYRDASLNISNWPKGVRCREFVDHGNTTWRPTR